ncbi:hypothetical protein NAC44_16145 [Allorhizobium sp. BGMRC 0089]|uniref:hypothetical protein n=1 Tax=Allorhizobium sonneratiae TaxID=2934936 RepID=UPI0020349498|nr:hypothetical protein [Allorhizobium sonneratiae]MCM2293858.1 hypothetical protein [Allorhizobium sonneratiae]
MPFVATRPERHFAADPDAGEIFSRSRVRKPVACQPIHDLNLLISAHIQNAILTDEIKIFS